MWSASSRPANGRAASARARAAGDQARKGLKLAEDCTPDGVQHTIT
jgi:hypothetical protein